MGEMMHGNICFITLNNLYLCPYIEKYISLTTTNYDIISWNRHNLIENNNAMSFYQFKCSLGEGSSKVKKLIGYLRFKRYASKIIKGNNYRLVILLQTSVGILLYRDLIRKYKNRYIIDIRDYTFENNRIFYKLEKKLIHNSRKTVISSEGYKEFLPQYEYILVHNDIHIDQKTIDSFREKKQNSGTLRISYIGLIRFHDQIKKIIQKCKDDNRFILRFIGKGSLLLKNFCDEFDVTNVELVDRFPPEETLNYYFSTDIINNLYGNDTPLLDYALSNKLYYAAKLGIPILVCKNTFMEKISKEYGFGYSFDLNDPLACDNLFAFYNSINWTEFFNSCDKFITRVNYENQIFNEQIGTILQEK